MSATERLLGIMTPSTPVASAVLNIEPRLCGSSRPSKINIVEKPSLFFWLCKIHQNLHIHMERLMQQPLDEVHLIKI